jgi:hypothetical protein
MITAYVVCTTRFTVMPELSPNNSQKWVLDCEEDNNYIFQQDHAPLHR